MTFWSVATHTTGVPSSSSAIGPCFISPAEYAWVGMYETSFRLSRPLRAGGVGEERLVVEALCDLLDRMRAVEEALDLARQLVELVEDELQLGRRHRPAHLGELEPDQREQRDLGGERLRGCHADLEAAARVEDRLRLARDLRAHQVRDRERASAEVARELHRVDRVARAPSVGDPDH